MFLQTYPNPLQDNPAYSVVKWVFFFHRYYFTQIRFLIMFHADSIVTWFFFYMEIIRQYFVDADDSVPQKVYIWFWSFL